MTKEFIKSAYLHFENGSSNKVYLATIKKVKEEYVVIFAYGRTGGTLKDGIKTAKPVTLEKAEKVFKQVVDSKVAKGYKPTKEYNDYFGNSTDITGIARVSDKKSSGVLPQLLNPIDESDVEKYITDDEWGLQEKKNGERRLVKKTAVLTGINRKGFEVPLPSAIREDIEKIKAGFLIDGEIIGTEIYLFDILELNGKDLRNTPYKTRYIELAALIPKDTESVKVVPLITGTKDKENVFKNLEHFNVEGIVFKLLSSPYQVGRPNSGGNQVKFKFWKSATCIVLGQNEDKRSVQLGVLDGDKIIAVGNCTIPANYDIPEKHTLVEVRYLYAYKGGSLYQPQYEGERKDLNREDCKIEQLSFIKA